MSGERPLFSHSSITGHSSLQHITPMHGFSDVHRETTQASPHWIIYCTTQVGSSPGFLGTVVSSGRMLTIRACSGIITPPGKDVPAGKYLGSNELLHVG